MLIGETVRVAFQSIRSNKLRAMLTMLGVIIGVAAVITVVAMGSGAQKAVEDRINALGANLVDFDLKARCCGGSLTGTIEEVGHRLVYILLHQAKLAKLFHRLARKLPRLINPCGNGRNFFLGKFTREIPNRNLLFRQFEIHGCVLQSLQYFHRHRDRVYLLQLSTDSVPALVDGYQAGSVPDGAHDQLGAVLACDNFRLPHPETIPWQGYSPSVETARLKLASVDLSAYEVKPDRDGLMVNYAGGAKTLNCYSPGSID